MVIFDGRKYAQEKEIELTRRVQELKEKGIVPHLASIVVGNVSGGLFYQKLKKEFAEKVGAELQIHVFDENIDMEKILTLVADLNTKSEVHGIMLQLPLPSGFTKNDREKIINEIVDEKDVDGMKENTRFLTPVVFAVLEVLKEAIRNSKEKRLIIAVVGKDGFVGKRILKELENGNWDVEIEMLGLGSKDDHGQLKNADVVISATGQTDLVKSNLVQDGSILIDVGSPKGDIEKSAYAKASFVSPVPGGVGPMTICLLIENLVKAAEYHDKS